MVMPVLLRVQKVPCGSSCQGIINSARQTCCCCDGLHDAREQGCAAGRVQTTPTKQAELSSMRQPMKPYLLAFHMCSMLMHLHCR